MKFGKELSAQMVSEWQDAYMSYNQLKAILKDILRVRPQKYLTPKGTVSRKGLKRRMSLYRAFSGLTSMYTGEKNKDDEESILVSIVDEEDDSEGCYQTMLLVSTDEGGDYEIMFFKRLDAEFNKVIKFYKKKVDEVVVEAAELTKQMNAMIALRIKVENPTQFMNISSSCADQTRPLSGWLEMDPIQEEERRRKDDSEEEKSQGYAKSNDESFHSPSLDILDHVKINVVPETPLLTLKGLLPTSKSNLSFSKDELRKVEEQMMKAFVEFYKKLRLLKSYCFLNQLAFSKIMKKYDKITGRNASKPYLKSLESSYLGNSDQVNGLEKGVEATFVKHFTNGNHRKGMKILRPVAKRERHRMTFFLGCFFGCSLALIVAIGVLIHARDLLGNSEGRSQYMENIFPLYIFFGLILLHMLMYSANIYFWKHYRVNYTFIFGFKEGTELGYREVLLVSSGISMLTLIGIISNLEMEMDPRTQSFKAITELVPLGLIIVLLLIVFCPFNIIYRSSRFFFIRCSYHCLLAPLYKVTLPDFFLADQLTSQVQALRKLGFYVCYYGWGDFKKRSNTCRGSDSFDTFHVIIAIIPYWIRFLQCIRRLFEEKDVWHGYNGIKYFSTIIAVSSRAIYELNRGRIGLKLIVAISSALATIINTYWDIVIDWGLLRKNSKNPWLRDKLLISNKSIYFLAMVTNVLLRLAWMQTVLGFTEAPFLHRKAIIAIVASLEIVRRGIWNFFRLENEHLNNVGKYRAIKSVPLPFHYGGNIINTT